MKHLITLPCLFILGVVVGQTARSDYPIVGKPLPDFKLTQIHYYDHKEFNPRHVKGKWIILDFWNKGCVACIQSFPKVDSFQREFKKQVQFILVGQENGIYGKGVQEVFERYRKVFNLRIASAYDSALFDRFKINGAPHVVIVDPHYTVYAVTYGSELTRDKLSALISGQRPTFRKKPYDFEEDGNSNPKWNYELNALDTTAHDFIFRSVLSKNKGEAFDGAGRIDRNVEKGFFQVNGATLGELYNIAYLGEAAWGRKGLYFSHWRYPLLELKDSSKFRIDVHSNEGKYNYSVAVPKEEATRDFLMKVMQRDLEIVFNYAVVIETRMMPYWRLRITNEARRTLFSQTDEIQLEMAPNGMLGKGISVHNILEAIEHYRANEDLPLIDETEFSNRFDITFSATMTDINDVRRALLRHGLILEKRTKPTAVLVIRDN